jgi:hypothetical protein
MSYYHNTLNSFISCYSVAKQLTQIIPGCIFKVGSIVFVYIYAFFDLGTRWGCVFSFTPRPLYPEGRSLWVGLGAVLDAVVERKISSPPPPGVEP